MGSQVDWVCVGAHDLQICVYGRVAETANDLRQERGGGTLRGAVCECEDGN